MSKSLKPKITIQQVYIENLFGYYNYHISIPDLDTTDSSLLIIYGDNGSGKTTILQLIFYLLSTLDNAGHKSKIAKIKFTLIRVLLSNNVEIIAKRDSNVIGSYTLFLKEDGKIKYSVLLHANDEYFIQMSDQGKSDNEKFDNILNYIKALNISLYFLTDNRKIFNSIENTDEDEKDDEDWIISRALFANRKKNTNNQNNEIIKAFNNLENWIKNQTLRGAQLGEENTNAIYDDIVSRITSSRKKKINFENITDLTNRLKQIREENKKYIRFGLTSIADTSKLEDSFSSPEQLKGEKLDIVYNIIEPYTNSLLAKLNSLKDIQSIILNFINTINSYLSNKHLDYNLAKGFTIIDDFNLEPIELGQLSSGERHLLLLLCNIVTISSAPTIYLIDEPEISLNVKWQRKLCRTLIEFSKGKNVQFLLATHSIELLSGFKNATVKLTNQSLIYGTKKFD